MIKISKFKTNFLILVIRKIRKLMSCLGISKVANNLVIDNQNKEDFRNHSLPTWELGI